MLVVSTSTWAGLRLKQERFEITYERIRNTQEIRVKGSIIISKGENAVSLLKLFRESVEPGLDIHLVLDMFGGDIALVNKIYAALKGKCGDRGYRSCAITTEIEMFRTCASACIPLFMVGDVRRASERADFGFHEAALIEGIVPLPFMSEYVLRSKGVNAAWLARNGDMFTSLRVSWRTPVQLNGSGIVTVIVRHRD